MSEVWRTIYVDVGAGREVAGFDILQEDYEQAVQFQRMLKDNSKEGWDGQYECKLECVVGDIRHRVVMRVTKDDIEFGEYGYEGYMPFRLSRDISESEGALFTTMLPYYAHKNKERAKEADYKLLTFDSVERKIKEEHTDEWEEVYLKRDA